MKQKGPRVLVALLVVLTLVLAQSLAFAQGGSGGANKQNMGANKGGGHDVVTLADGTEGSAGEQGGGGEQGSDYAYGPNGFGGENSGNQYDGVKGPKGQGSGGEDGEEDGGEDGEEDGGPDSAQRGPDSTSDGQGPHARQPGDPGENGAPDYAKDTLPADVELGRLNVARAPEHVIDHALGEVIATYLDGSYDLSLYGLPWYAMAHKIKVDKDVFRIDSPLENLALYREQFRGNDPITPAVNEQLGEGENCAHEFDRVALYLAGASDKTVPITVDTVVAMRVILGLSENAFSPATLEWSPWLERSGGDEGTKAEVMKLLEDFPEESDGIHSLNDLQLAYAADQIRLAIQWAHDH